MSEEKKEPGYVIMYQKQTSMLGEVITVNTALPKEATQEDLSKEFIKIGNALHGRMLELNKQVLEKTGKNLQEMGVDPGTGVFVPEGEK